MKIGKYNNDEFVTIECENGKEINGDRTLEELYEDGYKDVCEVEAPNETSTYVYQDYGTCFVQIWTDNSIVDSDESQDTTE